MVLSLFDLSLISISNGIKDGKIHHPDFLPPKLRQHVLDVVLKRRLVNNSNCLPLLTSIEFLTGMTSLSTGAGTIYDSKLLQRLKKSLSTLQSNGETLGSAIKKLDLNVYGCSCFLDISPKEQRFMTESSFCTVSRLIAQCPNTISLTLRGVESDGPLMEQYPNGEFYRHEPWFPSALNERSACNRVIEHLVELSICNWKTNVFGNVRPSMNFQRLATLKFDNCFVRADLWFELLLSIPTLENLHMIDVEYADSDSKGMDLILPFPMSHLKSLKIITIEKQYIFECNKTFVDNLIGCTEIDQVHLTLDEKSTDQASLVRLATMNIDLQVKARFSLHGNTGGNPYLDSSSRFKVVRIFHQMMDSFELSVSVEWDPQFSKALEDVVSSCSKLTTFHISLPQNGENLRRSEIKSEEEKKHVNAILVQFFSTMGSAHLQDLRLIGNFDEPVISAVFENCLNLVRLAISECPALRDQHLIDWVSRGGGKLTDLIMVGCENISSEGIIPVLARSAERLLRFNIRAGQGNGDGRDWKSVLRNHCPYARFNYSFLFSDSQIFETDFFYFRCDR